MPMKFYRMHPEQAALLTAEAIESGIPTDHIERVIRFADKAYLLGYADKTIGRPMNDVPYDPVDILNTLLKKTDKSTRY